MGQVLIHWEPELLVEQLDLPSKDKELLILELFRNVEWIAQDRGTLTEEEVCSRVCRRLPERLHPAVEELVFRWYLKPLHPVPGMAELIAELKSRGYGIYLLSNASTKLREYFPRIPGSEHFDALFVSAEHKLLKPEAEIFLAFLGQFRLRAETCFFVDDQPANVESAVRCGMTGSVFHGDANRLRRELQAAGVRVEV